MKPCWKNGISLPTSTSDRRIPEPLTRYHSPSSSILQEQKLIGFLKGGMVIALIFPKIPHIFPRNP